MSALPHYLPSGLSFVRRGPADELSAVIEFRRQPEPCHYTHIPPDYMHDPAARFPLRPAAVGGNRLMSDGESDGVNSTTLSEAKSVEIC